MADGDIELMVMMMVMVTMALVAICLVTDSGARMFGAPRSPT